MGSNHERRTICIGLLVLSLGLTACATTSPRGPDDAQASGRSGADAAAEAADLPRLNLDGDTLYNLLVGEIAGQRGQVAVAAVTLGRVARQTRDPRLAERATLAAIYAKRHEDALASASLWVELRPKQVEAREALASALMEVGKPVEAQLEFERILAQESAHQNLDQAFMRVAAVLGRHQNRTTALEVMQTLVQRYSKTAVAHFAYAHLAVRAGELDKGLAAVDRALELRSDWEEVALFKARILVSQKEMARAQAFYESYLASHPSATGVRLNYARHLIDQKLWEKARTQFERVVRETPADADAQYALGLLSLQTNRLEEADRHLQQAVHLRPDNDAARLYLGQVAEQRKRFDEATAWYKEITGGENLFEAQVRIGVLSAKQGQLAAAREYLRKITPENDQQRTQLALAEEQMLRDAKQYQAAYEVLTRTLERMPGNNDLLYARALICEKLNLIEAMENDLKIVIARDPKNAHALNALGYTLVDRTTRYDEARGYLERALVLKPDDPYILDSMGWLHYRTGNSGEAIRYLKRALEQRNDAEISAHLGEVLWVTGNRHEAESVWNRALREAPDNDAVLEAIKKFKP
jgi:tetratricopeptide (TPR) repeat protein